MTVKADIVRDASCASDARGQGFHQRRVPFTPETKDRISKKLLMKTNMTRSGEMLEFSVREQTSVTSPMRIQEYPGGEGACRRQVHEACRFLQEDGRTDAGSTGACQSRAAHHEERMSCAMRGRRRGTAGAKAGDQRSCTSSRSLRSNIGKSSGRFRECGGSVRGGACERAQCPSSNSGDGKDPSKQIIQKLVKVSQSD